MAALPPLPKNPRIAIVILNWNGEDYLHAFLPNVIANSQFKNTSIYVADNASTDNSVEVVRHEFRSVKLIINDKNYGFAGGYNQALAQIKGKADIYILLNSDVEVMPNWVAPLLRTMQADSSIVACQPKIKDFKRKTHFEYAGAAGGFMDLYGYIFCRGRFFDSCEADTGQYDTARQIFWASGAALFIRADAFHTFGGFDADFFAHMEEIDLCWRLKSAGYALLFCPDSVVYHVGGGTLPYGNPKKTYLNFRNNLAMLLKNMTPVELVLLLPQRLVLDVVAAFKAMAEGNFTDAKAIFKAQWHFVRKLPFWWAKRRHNQQLIMQHKAEGLPPNSRGRYWGSVIFDYFIRRKNKFSQIVK